MGALTRAAVLAGQFCTGERAEPMPPECLSLRNGAECTLPGDITIEGDNVVVRWPEGGSGFAVTAIGRARVHRGKDVFSADAARVSIQSAETNPAPGQVHFLFRPYRMPHGCE